MENTEIDEITNDLKIDCINIKLNGKVYSIPNPEKTSNKNLMVVEVPTYKTYQEAQEVVDKFNEDIKQYNQINHKVKDIAQQVVNKSKSIQCYLSADFTDPNKPIPCKLDNENYKIKCDDDLYIDNLPEGITVDTLKTLKQYNETYKAGVMLGVGKIAFDNRIVNGELGFVACDAPYVNNSVLVTTIFKNRNDDPELGGDYHLPPPPGERHRDFLFEQHVNESVDKPLKLAEVISYLDAIYLKTLTSALLKT